MISSSTQFRGRKEYLLRDPDIRYALVCTRLRHVSKSSTGMIVHELGLCHAKSRIDVATINGIIHGYEIKSAQDNLARLPHQLKVYGQSLPKLTLVVVSKHLKAVATQVPTWCGIIEASVGPRGGVRLKTIQKATCNPVLDPFLLAHLLWRNEVHDALACRGAGKSELRAPRATLYRQLVSIVSERELSEIIRQSMMRRQTWRDHSRPLLHDGL